MYRVVLIVLVLAGCDSHGVKECPTEPVVIETLVPTLTPVPAALTAHIPDPFPAPVVTVGDAEKAAEARRLSLGVCNTRLDQINALTPEK